MAQEAMNLTKHEIAMIAKQVYELSGADNLATFTKTCTKFSNDFLL